MAIIEGKLAMVELDICTDEPPRRPYATARASDSTAVRRLISEFKVRGDSGITLVDEAGNRVRITPESDQWRMSIEAVDPLTPQRHWPMDPQQHPFVG